MDRSWLLLRWLNSAKPAANVEPPGIVIGKGSFAEVQRLQDGRVLRVWLRSSRTDAVRELDLMSKLPRHPHLCQLLDVSPHGAILGFYGESLQQKLHKQQYLPADECQSLVGQCADGLAALHDFGVIHADLTPANMCVEKGHLTIIDFGKSLVEATMPPLQPDDVRNHLTTPLLVVEWLCSWADRRW